MTRISRTLYGITAAMVLAGAAVPASAEEGTVDILAPWESEGRVFPISPKTVLFQGVSDGIMYIQDGKGSLDAAPFVCPGTTILNAESGEMVAEGHCIITGADEDGVVFAEYECKGQPGACEGTFKITGGTERFEGITGGGKMAVRTALASVVADLESGEVVRGAEGLAVWSDLKYKIPEKK